MIEFDTWDGSGEARRMLEHLDRFLSRHGYPNAVGMLIIPLMDDGFGVLGATRGNEPMTSQQAFEYLIACADWARGLTT